MADLDDFFAKRDRKKGKTPAKKFSTPDEMAKKIEDTRQKSDVKVRKDRPVGQGQDGEDNGTMPGQDEDEWREFEVAKKDYTGLKIQPLGAGEMGGGQGGGQGGGGNNDSSTGGGGAQQTAYEQRARGPWNKGEAEPEEQQSYISSKNQAAEKEKEREREASEQSGPQPPSSGPPSTGAYITPQMRNRLSGSAGPSIEPLRNNRMMKIHAPDIHSEEYFPTLGGDGSSKKSSGNSGGGAWTEAGSGGRVAVGAQRADTNTALQLGNRFTSLTHDS